MYDGYRVSFPDVEWQGRSCKHPTLSTAAVKAIVQLHRISTCLQGKLQGEMYEGWNFNSGNSLFKTDTK